MFDINNIVNAAITEAVNARLTEVLQQHANTIAPLVDQIHNLDAICQAQAERIAALENQAIVTSNAVDTRIAALENNPAQGVDSEWDIGRLEQRVAALESETQGENRYLNRDDVAELIAEAMDDHTSTYDHDSYDNAVSDLEDRDFDDYVTRDSVREEIEDVINNATISIRA